MHSKNICGVFELAIIKCMFIGQFNALQLMQIKSKWTMRGHFKHLRFKNFLIVSWGPNLVFFSFSTKALNICNSHTNVTPKVGMHLGIIGLHPLHSPSFVRMCFTPKHTFGLMGPYASHFVTNIMLGLWHLTN